MPDERFGFALRPYLDAAAFCCFVMPLLLVCYPPASGTWPAGPCCWARSPPQTTLPSTTPRCGQTASSSMRTCKDWLGGWVWPVATGWLRCQNKHVSPNVCDVCAPPLCAVHGDGVRAGGQQPPAAVGAGAGQGACQRSGCAAPHGRQVGNSTRVFEWMLVRLKCSRRAQSSATLP